VGTGSGSHQLQGLADAVQLQRLLADVVQQAVGVGRLLPALQQQSVAAGDGQG